MTKYIIAAAPNISFAHKNVSRLAIYAITDTAKVSTATTIWRYVFHVTSDASELTVYIASVNNTYPTMTKITGKTTEFARFN
jgi:hypothetical protein